MVLLGLKQAGGWGGMKASFATAVAAHGSAPAGWNAMATAVTLGIVLTAGLWFTDFSLLQTTLAAQNARAARRAPLLAAAVKAVLPFLLVLPGVISASLPTPHTTITMHNENGEIFHEIDVVPQAVDQGMGLVPALTDSIIDPLTGNVLKDAGGHVRIDYGMATPGLLPHNLPTGLLGLGVAALLACLTGGVAARITAFNTVFVGDVYQVFLRKQATEKHLLAVGRWTTLGAVVVSSAMAWGALRVHSMPELLDLLAISLAVLFAPLVGTLLLGVFWKRTTGCGAFAGLLAGIIAALVHWGITVPAGYSRGFAGGWMGGMHHPASFLTQNADGAMLSIIVNVLVTILTSLLTKRRPEAELAGLVHTMGPVPEKTWWKRPAGVAFLILLLAIVVSLILV